MSFEGWTNTHEADSIVPDCTITYSETTGSPAMVVSGGTTELTDRSIEYPSTGTQRYMSLTTPVPMAELPISETRTWEIDFSEEKTVSVEIPFYAFIDSVGFASASAKCIIYIYRWDSESSSFLLVEDYEFLLAANESPPEGATKEKTGVAKFQGITTSKIQVWISTETHQQEEVAITFVFPEIIVVENNYVNVAPQATIDFSPFDITEKMKQRESVSLTVDGQVGGQQEGFGWAMDTSSSGDSFLETGINIIYELTEAKTVEFVRCFESLGTLFGEDSYIFSECIISYWDGESYVQAGKSNVYNDGLNYQRYFSRTIGKQTNKIKIHINLQGISYANYNSGYLIWYLLQEVEIFTRSLELSVDCHPIAFYANVGSASPVKIFANGEVYSCDLVDTADLKASALRIFDGTNIKAFKLE